MLISNITSQDSNHLPHYLHCDVLPTKLRMACSNRRGKMIYEGCGDHRGRTGHALVFFYFPANNGSMNPDVFSLKPSLSQGK